MYFINGKMLVLFNSVYNPSRLSLLVVFVSIYVFSVDVCDSNL
jgi:hypothetical protein